MARQEQERRAQWRSQLPGSCSSIRTPEFLSASQRMRPCPLCSRHCTPLVCSIAHKYVMARSHQHHHHHPLQLLRRKHFRCYASWHRIDLWVWRRQRLCDTPRLMLLKASSCFLPGANQGTTPSCPVAWSSARLAQRGSSLPTMALLLLLRTAPPAIGLWVTTWGGPRDLLTASRLELA